MISPFLSTLSLRRATLAMAGYTKAEIISIHALLAESDCSFCPADSQGRHFYPRSPCGERRMEPSSTCTKPRFLSTLSLRRATPRCRRHLRGRRFLSTLSLRRATLRAYQRYFAADISIHALLAESDQVTFWQDIDDRISIHALLAESDILRSP